MTGMSSGAGGGAQADNPTRRTALDLACNLFNSGQYWEAHEALEAVWRSVEEGQERRVWQGLIQAAAALLHWERGNSHGMAVVGKAALEKLAGGQHPSVELETIRFRAALARVLAGEGNPPQLEWRDDQADRR
jgi:uncharacterized protein